VRRNFHPHRRVRRSYGDGSTGVVYKGSPNYRFYEKEQAEALLQALGVDTSQRQSKKDGTYRNWDMLLLARDKEDPAFARLLLWTTGPDIYSTLGKAKSIPWGVIQDIEPSREWAKGEANAFDLAKAYFDLRWNLKGRTGAPATPSAGGGEETLPVKTSGGGGGGGGSSYLPSEESSGDSGGKFPWLPVVGGSVLVLGLGIGGYIFYKRRKTT